MVGIYGALGSEHRPFLLPVSNSSGEKRENELFMYVCVSVCVYMWHACFCISFSLLGSYAKFVRFLSLCSSKSPKKINLPGIFHLVLQPKSV